MTWCSRWWGYHVATQQHYFDIIPDTGYPQTNFTGINYTRIELDFIVG